MDTAPSYSHFDFSYPIIIAHRGSSAYAPENTLAAFNLAVEQGADALELDAKLSADGYVVVIHDQTVDRTTDHSGRVKDLTLQELKEMDAGGKFDSAFKGEEIPTLGEVFEEFGKKIYINVELTNYASIFDELPNKVASLINRHQLNQQIFFSSFNPIALKRIGKILPEAPLGLLALSGIKGVPIRTWPGRLLKYQSLHIEIKDTKPDLVERVHQRNEKLFVYTVNQEQEIERLFKMDVDGIITDDPILGQQVLNRIQLLP